MDFLKKHGEKVLFILLLIALVASVFLAMNAKSNLQSTVNSSPNAGKVEMTLDTETLKGYITHLSGEAPQLNVVTNAFTPSVRVMCMSPDDDTLIPVDAKICPYCGYEQTERVRDTDGDTIADKQELEWGLDPNDPKDVYLDQDNDGFTTLVEVKAGFSPVDASSHPPLVYYLRLGDVVESSIEFELRGIAKLGDKHTLQLYWKYPDQDRGHTEYIKEGTNFGRNKEFLVESYQPKRTLIDGKYMDKSKGVIRSGGHKLELYRTGEGHKGKITESTGTLYLIMGPKWEEAVRVNETIQLDKKSYIIVDINSQTVVIKPDAVDPNSAKTITVQKANQEELDSLKPAEPEMNSEFMEEGMPLDMQRFYK